MSDTDYPGVLRGAAQRLRKLADDDLAPSWRWGMSRAMLRDTNGDPVADVSEAEGHWMATLGPQVAEPLAQWLETTARYVHFETGQVSSPEKVADHMETKYAGAIQFARTILDGAP